MATKTMATIRQSTEGTIMLIHNKPTTTDMLKLGVTWDGMWTVTEGPIDTTDKVSIHTVETTTTLETTTVNDT
jgi:hypothetical protein